MELRDTKEPHAKLLVIEQTLAAVPFLRALSPRRRAHLARLATTRRYPAGAVIVRQGDTSMAAYVVLSGAVRIGPERQSVSGADDALAGPGAFFGEMGVIHDRPRAETVVAVEPTECALIAKWDFTALLYAQPQVALDLMLRATLDEG